MEPDLIGRATECRALEELLDAVRGGQSRALVVRGDAGIGKSALLRHLIGAASGFRVVQAGGVESEMELPFAALHQLCASMLEHLDSLPAPQRDAVSTAFGLAAGNSPDRLLIGLAVLNLMSAASDDAPLLCVIDDVQWLDHESTQALAFVARRIHAERVAVVFATRHATIDLANVPDFVVDRLNDDDAQTLLGAVLRARVDGRVRDRIVAETHGNPLALIEWPRGLTPAELGGGFGMPARLAMTGQIEESFRRRIAELQLSSQRLLTVAAAEPTGDSVLVWRAARALGIGPQDAAPAIERGLVEIAVRVSFRHPLVRSAAYNAAALTDRQAAHRALAEATDPDLDPDRRAWHRALGAPGPDEDIADALEHSADRARARGGLAAAAALLERSVILSVEPTRRVHRILAAAGAHLEAGSFDVAAEMLALAQAADLDEMQRVLLDMLRARHALFAGNMPEVASLFLRAASRLEPVDVDSARDAYLHAFGAAAVVGSFGHDVGLHEVCEAAITCPLSSVPTTKDWLLIGLARYTVDGPSAAGPALRRALQSSFSNSAEEVHRGGLQIAVAMLLWDVDSMRKFAISTVETAREIGALAMLPSALNTLATVLVLDGDLDAAAASLAEAEQIEALTGSRLQSTTVVALHAGLQGDDGAASVIENQLTNARARSLGLSLASALWAHATLYNGIAQYDLAMSVANEAIRTPWQQSAVFFHELVEAAVRCGQRAIAAATLERLEEATEPSGTDWAVGIQRRSAALLADGSVAEGLYREAIERLGRTSLRPELARAHLLFGEWLRRENRRVEARDQLRIAYEMFTAMGIHGFAGRTRDELAATGETLRKRSADSFDELTSQEARIARLAADGQTNQEIGAQLFISPRTVEWHLRNAYIKLNVASRRGLRDVLPQQARLTAST